MTVDRENFWLGVAATIVLACTGVAFFAVLSRPVPTWCVIAGFVCGGLVLVPLFVFLFLMFICKAFTWVLGRPLQHLGAAVRQDDARAIFPILVGAVQAGTFAISSELLGDEVLRIIVGTTAGLFSATGGVFAVLAKNRVMYASGVVSITFALAPIVVAASHYNRWTSTFTHLGVRDQIAIVWMFIACIGIVVLVAISLANAKRASRNGSQ